jgi:hypothetical protein
MTYSNFVNGAEKPLRWLHGEVKTPPFSRAARLEAGLLLRRLQQGESPSLPIRDRCPILARAVTNFACVMKARIGVSFIALMRIAS